MRVDSTVESTRSAKSIVSRRIRRCLRVATIHSSRGDHPGPPIHSGGSWPLWILLGRHRCLRDNRPAWCSAASFRYSMSSLVHGCWPVPSNHPSVDRPARSGLSGSGRRRAYPWRQPAKPEQRADSLGHRLDKFPGVVLSGSRQTRTHELALPGRGGPLRHKS